MLAHRFADHQSSITYPVYIQPKLNGVRMLYNSDHCQSRDEFLYSPDVLKHIRDELRAIIPTTWYLDGELYVHGWSLQQINSAVGVNRKAPSKVSHMVEYHIFDMVDSERQDLPFQARAENIGIISDRMILRGGQDVIRIVPTSLCNAAEAEHLYSYYRKQNYEGTMYRSVLAPYGFVENCTNKENRWKCLLKRKEWMDEWCRVLGFNLTEGEKGEQGFQMLCETEDGAQFTVGSGLTEVERELYVERPPARVKVKYECRSDNGTPLKPTIEEVEE